MRVFLVCLLAAGCAAQAPVRIVYVPVRPEPVAVTPPVIAESLKVVAVVKNERHLVADAGRYVVWKQSKASIIDQMGTLMATAAVAVRQLQEAKTLQDRAAALPAAEAAVEALRLYLQTKGD
jgi:hypothetical protein